jgi:biotin synthase
LLDEARAVHRANHPDNEVQLCTLLSVKTGGCAEDCSYCPQSSHYDTNVGPEKMLDVDHVIASARRAKELGSTRFCMGAAWREVKDGPAFDRVLAMVRGVKDLGLEACVTLGMVTEEQAKRLADAGLDAYNHNLDTSRENYRSIIKTRTFDDRLRTLENVRKAGVTVCSGGIIGMGESIDDRCEMLRTLANLEPQPESVPINALVPVEGTPLANMPPVDPLDLVRMIAVARPHAQDPGASLRGAHVALARGAAHVHARGRELDLLRGEAAHDAEPRRGRRPGAHPRRGSVADGAVVGCRCRRRVRRRGVARAIVTAARWPVARRGRARTSASSARRA